ncbi:hypothetical protein DR864_10015 [Runella rosea]|uniref:GmrSD restriction endonucleases N-terminal domain-containing protein n=1 Tax=Runella rosea TaxID=2259595 RepID=A0A344THC5_9BACT|nr:DUF262 domain-containing protein [Runella rosea]AXE18046.1 hypothetical protein DR864_10015 [Runella rosea]
MASVTHVSEKYSDFISRIESGRVRIPHFQRNFVWELKASAKLVDSMLKGYPIGTFILWQTQEELRSVRSIGNLSFPEQRNGESVYYILDGQQRITSFFAAITGAKIERERGKVDNFSEIYINLMAGEDDDIVITETNGLPEKSYIRVTDLINGSFALLGSFPTEYHESLLKFQNNIRGWNFNITYLNDAKIDVATDVFTRLNVGGKTLSLFEIMVAKTYKAPKVFQAIENETNNENSFDLLDSYQKLIEELKHSKYDTISPSTILQVVSILLVGGCTRKQILELEKEAFISIWESAVKAIKASVDYFRTFGIPVSELLPYNALVVPFSYCFYKHPDVPVGEMQRRLEDFFWRCALGSRYSSGVENKLANDIQKIDKILDNKLPYYEWSINISPEELKRNGWFGTSRSFIKGILCLYAMQKPKSFHNHFDVLIDNSWLKKSTSKNYHHFFPIAFMRREYPTMDYWRYNHILNITIVDDFLNKRIIRDKAPARYMKEIGNNNNRLAETLLTHFISDFQDFGVEQNDYEMFFNARAIIVSSELKKRIVSEVATGEEEQQTEEEYNEEN